jgi:hypothetical protein
VVAAVVPVVGASAGNRSYCSMTRGSLLLRDLLSDDSQFSPSR